MHEPWQHAHGNAWGKMREGDTVLRSAMPVQTPLRMRSYFTLCACGHGCLSYSEHRLGSRSSGG
jgi:hypothetical protein